MKKNKKRKLKEKQIENIKNKVCSEESKKKRWKNRSGIWWEKKLSLQRKIPRILWTYEEDKRKYQISSNNSRVRKGRERIYSNKFRGRI